MGIIDLAVGGFRYLRPLRTLRALRPLRLVRRYESLKVVVKAFLFAIPKISGLVVVLMVGSPSRPCPRMRVLLASARDSNGACVALWFL
jgi:hypothetical protein